VDVVAVAVAVVVDVADVAVVAVVAVVVVVVVVVVVDDVHPASISTTARAGVVARLLRPIGRSAAITGTPR
jgi:hypothetical protein